MASLITGWTFRSGWQQGIQFFVKKDLGKGNAVDYYRPISCLPVVWKLMIAIIGNSVYEYLEIASSRAERMQEKQTRDKRSTFNWWNGAEWL